MTTKTKTEKQVAEEKKKEEVKFDPSEYSCEIILEKTTKDKAEDRKFPTDAFIVRYLCDGTECLDVTRSGKQANVFDMYYDRYGKDSVKRIDWGHGTVNPSSWGYKTPEKKKRRK
jgi:hypothetical protein|tara:strand:+ start:222 stop:566 length:345 start_codon:yes stop_codon:yes gene_type:complete